MWNDLYLNRELEDEEIKKWIRHSYDEVVKKLTKSVRTKYQK
jgi:predicted DNA-binding protein (MmcQ/YjbR family)